MTLNGLIDCKLCVCTTLLKTKLQLVTNLKLDFRGIAISPVISKIFEHCILKRFGLFLRTSHNQFGCKKGISCSHAIRVVRSAVDTISLKEVTLLIFV